MRGGKTPYVYSKLWTKQQIFDVAEDKDSSNIMHLWKIRITNSKCNDRAKWNGQLIVFFKLNIIVIWIECK